MLSMNALISLFRHFPRYDLFDYPVFIDKESSRKRDDIIRFLYTFIFIDGDWECQTILISERFDFQIGFCNVDRKNMYTFILQRLYALFSICGISFLHGAHHVPQKFRKTPCPL